MGWRTKVELISTVGAGHMRVKIGNRQTSSVHKGQQVQPRSPHHPMDSPRNVVSANVLPIVRPSNTATMAGYNRTLPGEYYVIVIYA
jgi:hypothetical protein